MSDDPKVGCGCLVLLLIVAVIFGIVYYSSADNITGTIEKTVVQDGETYFIIKVDGATESEIFENEDTLFFFKFDSGNVLMDLEVGETYGFKVAGWRVPFLSWYRNIITFTVIE